MNPKKIISVLFSTLFFMVPLILYPYTSELFEFNKMIFTYLITILIIFFWIYRCIIERKIIFKRTLLDVPILLFLTSQIISTLISVDVRTSLLGYYSRFNGGLVSLIGYSLLYWAYVSNLERKDVHFSIMAAIVSTVISSLYGIMEHFGIDKNIWIQDVQNRVFSTFGQPNWLAAWLVAFLPVSQIFVMEKTGVLRVSSNYEGIDTKINNNKNLLLLNAILIYLIPSIFFITLLYTKSRSGILAFAISEIVLWGTILLLNIKNRKKNQLLSKPFLILHLIFLLLTLLVGSPWSPSVKEIVNKLNQKPLTTTHVSTQAPITPSAPALEVGGSSSAEIRRIVWKGAIDVWKHYPLFGSGVETFAFSYYQFRPTAHNMVSEWDFLYNKAHNEYLNFMATTGSVGIVTYFILIVFSMLLILIPKNSNTDNIDQIQRKGLKYLKIEIRLLKDIELWQIALFSGYLTILITNFFGFSVVPVNLLFFLFPAMATCLRYKNDENEHTNKGFEITSSQKTGIAIVAILAFILLNTISRYWYADILYNRADGFSKTGNLIDAVNQINSAIKLSPHEAIYYDKLADLLENIASFYNSQGNSDSAIKYGDNAFKTIQQAEQMSPNNLNIIRNKAKIALKLSEINSIYILEAKKALLRGIELAPTDAKLYYNLSLTYYRIQDVEKAKELLKKTIELKPNYRDAFYAYAILLSEEGEKDKAREYLQYILDRIDPKDQNTKKALEEIYHFAKQPQFM